MGRNKLIKTHYIRIQNFLESQFKHKPTLKKLPAPNRVCRVKSVHLNYWAEISHIRCACGNAHPVVRNHIQWDRNMRFKKIA